MQQTQIQYEDQCSKCKQPCTRVRRHRKDNGTIYVTSCCSAPPMAVKKEAT